MRGSKMNYCRYFRVRHLAMPPATRHNVFKQPAGTARLPAYLYSCRQRRNPT